MYIFLIILLNISVLVTIFIVNKKKGKNFLIKDYLLLILAGGIAAVVAYTFNTIGQNILNIIFIYDTYFLKSNNLIYTLINI